MLAGCASTSFEPSAPAVRLTPVNENQTVTLAGNVHPLVRPEFDRGPLDPSTPFDRILLVLKPSAAQQSSLDALVAAQQNPASPRYHQWLTPAEFGAQFGAAPAQIAQITAWLTSHGFTIEEVPAGNRLIAFSGTAGQLQETFHTQMRSYRIATPNQIADHISNSQNPQIPAALAGSIAGIVSLNDFRRISSLALRQLPAAKPAQAQAASTPQYSAGSTHYLAPADFATIYDLNPLYNAGSSGAGTSIAIAGRGNINLADIAQFHSTTGLASNPPSVILDGADPGLAASGSRDNDQAEATLDIEWSGAVAPAAAVTLVTAASTATTDGIDLASTYIVNHATARILSSSYSNCEQEMGAAELIFHSALWEQAAAEGISVFVSSGDAGAAGCSAGSDASGSTTAVNGLCSSPYATCVGGTEFNEGENAAQYWAAANSASLSSALQYIPEEVWNESTANGGSGMWSSGGGASTVYAQPAWQASVPGASATDGMRAVPDVSLTAADHDGAIMVENGGFYIASGTSVAAPSFAGIMALIVASQDGRGQGSANSRLYALAASSPAAFHPTPSGNNTVPGVTGQTANGAVYNLATGLGSVDAAQLVSNWASPPAQTCPMRLVRTRCRSGIRPWILFR